MRKSILVLFPGVRYSADCPLLYYTRLGYSYAGFEYLAVDYGVTESEDLGVFADKAVKNIKKQFEKLELDSYKEIIFAEKSIGTVIGMRIEDELNLKNVYHIVYTPIEETFKYLSKERKIIGMAAGTEDKHMDIKAITATCKKLETELVVIKNSGHRLEAGKDVTADISALVKVINKIGDPSAFEKYKKAEEKKIEDAQKAAKEKAEADKAAKEKAAKAEAAKKAAEEKAKEIKKASDGIKPNKKHVRKFIPDDIEELMELWLISNVKEQSFIPKKYWNKNFTEIRRIVELSEVFVYEENSKILGFISSMEAELVGIYVAEGFRSKGIGKLLMEKMKDKMGILEASVYTKNKKAMAFFDKEEFQATSIRIDEATGEEEVLLRW